MYETTIIVAKTETEYKHESNDDGSKAQNG